MKKFLLPTWALVIFSALFGHYFLSFLYVSVYGRKKTKHMSVSLYTRNLYVDRYRIGLMGN